MLFYYFAAKQSTKVAGECRPLFVFLIRLLEILFFCEQKYQYHFLKKLDYELTLTHPLI